VENLKAAQAILCKIHCFLNLDVSNLVISTNVASKKVCMSCRRIFCMRQVKPWIFHRKLNFSAAKGIKLISTPKYCCSFFVIKALFPDTSSLKEAILF